MIYYETDYLMHHGVKGMKWGRRKQRVAQGVGRTMSRYSPTKQNIRRLAKNRAFDKKGKLKSTKRIVGETIAADAIIGVGGGVVADILQNNGYNTLANVTSLATTGAAIANSVLGITSAVQRGRGRYGK